MCLAKDKDQARIVVRLLQATRIGNPRVGATPDLFFSPPGHGPGQGRDAVS